MFHTSFDIKYIVERSKDEISQQLFINRPLLIIWATIDIYMRYVDDPARPLIKLRSGLRFFIKLVQLISFTHVTNRQDILEMRILWPGCSQLNYYIGSLILWYPTY